MSKLRVEEKDGVITITNREDCWKLDISQYSNKGPHVVISNSRDQEMAIVWVDTVTEKLHVRADEDVEIPTRRR